MTQRPLKILVIDDEEDLVEMLALRLRSTGRFEVETAYDGAAGLEKARTRLPDVVLLDNVMPGMDGWEVCRRLREDAKTKGLRIVVMTAGSPGKAQAKGREARADFVLLKPYDHEQLIAVLEGKEGAHAQNGQEAPAHPDRR